MKITKALLKKFQKAKSANALQFDIGFNDAWNKANLGMTREEYNKLAKLERLTGGVENFSVGELNEFLKEGWA